jgi:hypothetical protein
MGTQTTQNQALATTGTATLSRYNEADVAQEMKILKAAFPRLSSLGDEQARALIVASRMSGLNPFKGEIYYVPSVGITVAAKVRAGDAVSYQAKMGNTLDIRFEKVTPETCDGVYAQFAGALTAKDTAVACRIISSKQRREHYAWRIQLADEGRAYGYQGKALEDWVNAKAGAAPEVIALGIVKGTENFGGDEKYSRFDRASKRALNLALNKGGWHAPDTRNYGGVALEEEREARRDTAIEGEYREVERNIPQRPNVTMPEWGDEPDAPAADRVIEPPVIDRPAQPKSWKDDMTQAANDAKAQLVLAQERNDVVLASKLDTAITAARSLFAQNGSAKTQDIETALGNLKVLVAEAKKAQEPPFS